MAVGVGALLLVALHLAVAFTENVNGDELGLLNRALVTSSTGEVQGGGRPGLGTLALVPFARNCADAVRAVVQARLFWTVFVVGAAVAFVILLRQFLPADRHRFTAILTALGLWILAPAFLEYSVQVRTDQAAICLGLWCGVALLASQRRRGWALVAGALFGLGFLFSQKAAYVGGLMGVLTLGRLAVDRNVDVPREAIRAVLLLVGAAGVLLGYRVVAAAGGEAPALVALSGNLDSRAFYRSVFGYRYFVWMLPPLLPQVVALGLVAAVSVDWLRTRGQDGARIATAWGVVGFGLAVFLFHATRAPYFYLVVGLFPATAGGLVLGPVLRRLETPRERSLLLGVLWVPLAAVALYHVPDLLRDTQRPQREALAFVERNFSASAYGFQSYSLFMCRHDPEAFQFLNYRILDVYFGGPEGEARTEAMIRGFRSRPVSFLTLPASSQFIPSALRNFWLTHYTHYAHHIWVPGTSVQETRSGSVGGFDAVVRGRYRWWPEDTGARLLVDGAAVAPGQTVDLSVGFHALGLPDGGGGRLMLDLAEPPSDPPELPLFQPWPSPGVDLQEAGRD